MTKTIRKILRVFWFALLVCVVVMCMAGVAAAVYRLATKPEPNSPEALLEKADALAWLNNWVDAEPLYKQAESMFLQQHKAAQALYAHVSQIPPSSGSSSMPDLIWRLTQDLARPEAQNAETRLRILTIRGMVEINYDAATARSTWGTVEDLAKRQHRYLLASRAAGEQGIAAFLLGDTSRAKQQVLQAWGIAKTFHDSAAIVRYSSAYGAGLVQLRKYDEALGPLDDAINRARSTPGMAYPSIAVNYKIAALSGLRRYSEALALSSEALRYPRQHNLEGALYSLLETRGEIYASMGDWSRAVADYKTAADYARHISYWRGLSEGNGPLARAYEHQGQLQEALSAVNEAIEANERIPDELYFVPQNLAIKAEILAKLGQLKASNSLYQKSADLIDSLLTGVPTPQVERLYLAELSDVYSGYFASLCNQGAYPQAFQIIEKVHGRIEAQSLQHHQTVQPHQPTTAEQQLTNLNIQLINTDDSQVRQQLLAGIYDVEQRLDPVSFAGKTASDPVSLAQLQQDLQPTELIVEYVLDEPQSYALAITARSVNRYILLGKNTLESQITQYRSTIAEQKEDKGLAQVLFNELLGPITEYRTASHLIVIPDGELHLLPFAALVDSGLYLLSSHTISAVESGTVLHILRTRQQQQVLPATELPYLGVAPWIKTPDTRNIFLRAIGAISWPESLRRISLSFPTRGTANASSSGPDRSKLIALPESRNEVESIADELPKPNTLLLGDDATKTHFKDLPLNEFNVIDLALHGYADLEYPDRSALVFAPQKQGVDDGLLQVREIRHLHLNASLVTLSACNTGVGPVGQAGVANLVGAFVEAGAQSVVSTLWELEDHSSSRLMRAFYDRLARHEEKAEALRHAQMTIQSVGYPPYYWASFELVGNPTGTLNTTANLAARNRQ
jgi:CHAT domain-containing protein